MSLNDPNWGRGGSRGPQGPGGGKQGPPDLDELWRSFNRKLNDLFGKRGGGSEPPSEGRGGPNPAQIGGGALILAGLVLVVWLASGFYIVVEGTRGVVLTFGKFAEETQSGLRWRMPWPIQTHEIVNLSQVRTLEIGYRNSVKTKVLKESLMLTDDENIVDLQFAVQYTVKDVRDYVFSNKRPDEAVMQAAETAAREIIGKSRMDQILYESREEIAIKTRQLMQVVLDRYKTGVSISNVTIQNAQPPEQVQAAFDDAVKAGQDRERQKNEGQSYANDVIPKASGTAARLMQEAEGYKQRQRGRRGLALQAGAGRVLQGACGHARADLPRHHAADPVVDLQGPVGHQGKQQPAVPAARQAAPEERPGRGASGERCRAAGRRHADETGRRARSAVADRGRPPGARRRSAQPREG